MSPRLLVSVRDSAEANAALKGGCDVLDLKEPRRGPLGMVDLATMAAVVVQARAANRAVPVSAALGEAGDWGPRHPLPPLPAGIDYLKLGTAGLEAPSSWQRQFASVMRQYETGGPGGPTGGRAGMTAEWIVVAYADWVLARGPHPEQVIDEAAPAGCTGILIDTFAKGNKRLTDWLAIGQLESLAGRARARGLTLAVAGTLMIEDLVLLRGVRPDIVGIRSAACRDGIRNGAIDAKAVAAFRAALVGYGG